MKIIKYTLIAATFLLVGYNSITIQTLDKVKRAGQKFDAVVFAREYWTKTLPSAFDKAVSITDLVGLLTADKTKAFDAYSHAVSIGNVRYFLVKGEGLVSKISEDEVMLLVKNGDKTMTVRLATEFIYGSAVRDAAGLFDIKPFTNNNDINNVASEINKIVKTEVVPPFKKGVNLGNTVSFIGAVEMNQQHPQLDNLEVLPIELNIKPN